MGWYDRKVRRVRDLSCGDTRIFLELEVRRVDCRRCGKELNLGALVCEHCQALVYSQELDRLADSAKVLEAKGQLRQAREQ